MVNLFLSTETIRAVTHKGTSLSGIRDIVQQHIRGYLVTDNEYCAATHKGTSLSRIRGIVQHHIRGHFLRIRDIVQCTATHKETSLLGIRDI